MASHLQISYEEEIGVTAMDNSLDVAKILESSQHLPHKHMFQRKIEHDSKYGPKRLLQCVPHV